MKTPSKKDLFVFSTCTLVGAAVMFGAVYYKKHVTQMAQMSLTAPNVAVAVAPPPKPRAAYVLKNQPSPFAPRESASLAVPRPINIPVPLVPSVSLSSSPAPQAVRAASTSSGRSGLHVESVFLGQNGKNMAIVSNGKDSATVREGQESKFGHISGITRDGLYADGAFISVSKEVSAPSPSRKPDAVSLPPVPVEPPSMDNPVTGEQQQITPQVKPAPVNNGKNRSET